MSGVQKELESKRYVNTGSGKLRQKIASLYWNVEVEADADAEDGECERGSQIDEVYSEAEEDIDILIEIHELLLKHVTNSL